MEPVRTTSVLIGYDLRRGQMYGPILNTQVRMNKPMWDPFSSQLLAHAGANIQLLRLLSPSV